MPYGLAHLEDPHERIEWSAFLVFMENAQRLWTAAELERMGGAWIDSPPFRHARLVTGALLTPRQLYRWIFAGPARVASVAFQTFTCVRSSHRDVDAGHVELEVTLDEGYPPCPAFFLLTKGGLTELPRMVGRGRASVEMSLTERGARYVVTLPPGSDRRGFLRRAVAWITSPAAVARELSEAHAKLLVRYDELDSARSALAAEAARLEELRRARDVLAATVTDLHEIRAVRERIFANVNHDLRTPLSNIMLAVSIIRSAKETSGNATIGRALETIERSAARQLRLVDDMLLLAESREQELHVRPRPCDLRGLVDDVLRGWAPIAQARGLELRAETATPCHVNGDPDAMERILANLLSNAVKFTPHGGRVEVRLTSQHDRAMLEVRDTGRGIDKELLPRLFGRFERGGAAASGSGIGLSIVKELVLAQRGTIDVVTPEGGGAAFRISWPLLDRAEARHADALG